MQNRLIKKRKKVLGLELLSMWLWFWWRLVSVWTEPKVYGYNSIEQDVLQIFLVFNWVFIIHWVYCPIWPCGLNRKPPADSQKFLILDSCCSLLYSHQRYSSQVVCEWNSGLWVFAKVSELVYSKDCGHSMSLTLKASFWPVME